MRINKIKNTRNLFLYTALCLMALWLLGACSQYEEDTPAPVERVLLVYLAGDNNLSGESRDKLEAIKRGWDHSPTARILIFHDPIDSAPRLYELGSEAAEKLIEQYAEDNSAGAAVFRRVIDQAKTLYPQAEFNLLVFSHASGWLPAGNLVRPRSVLVDGKDEMELADFAAAIPDKAFKHIVFETCFMAGIEVAYQLKDKAEYIAASSAEIVSPGFTSVYSKYINELAYGSPQKFMEAAFACFDSQSGYMHSATFSLIKTAGLGPLAGFVRQNCDFEREVLITGIQHFDRNSYRLFADFEDYYSSLVKTDAQRSELAGLLAACVVWKASTPYFMEGYNGFAIRKHSGMTAYIMQQRYPLLNEAYRNLDWCKAARGSG
jgi:hypothetical protein